MLFCFVKLLCFSITCQCRAAFAVNDALQSEDEDDNGNQQELMI